MTDSFSVGGLDSIEGTALELFKILQHISVDWIYLTYRYYSEMHSDWNTLKFNVVITKFLRRHYRTWASTGIWNPWSKYILIKTNMSAVDSFVIQPLVHMRGCVLPLIIGERYRIFFFFYFFLIPISSDRINSLFI